MTPRSAYAPLLARLSVVAAALEPYGRSGVVSGERMPDFRFDALTREHGMLREDLLNLSGGRHVLTDGRTVPPL